MKYFIFLEFIDPKLNNFLVSLRNTLMGREIKKPVHVTIRGPYDSYPDHNTLMSLKESLQGYGICVGGAGTFDVNGGYSVHLRVSSQVFSDADIWWKPDFSVEKFGMNPHITMYEGKDRVAASTVEKFLRAEKIEIFTINFTLSVYVSKQLELFDGHMDHSAELIKRRASIGKWKVKNGILRRAASLRQQLEGKEGAS